MRRPPASVVALLLLAAAAPSRAPPSQSRDASRQAAVAEAARAAALTARDAAAARAAQAAAAAAALTAARVKATAGLRAAEAATLRSADRMADLARDQAAAESGLNARAATIAPLLPLIERLSLYPAETLLAIPESPEDAVRGLLVLKGISQRLESEAAALRREQATLEAARAATAAEAPRLAAAESAQQEAARDLDRQIAATNLDRRAAETESAADARKAGELAARADSLRALMAQIEERQREPKPTRRAPPPAPPDEPPAGPSGAFLVPVTGTVVRAWGAPTDAGPAAGVSYRAAPNARVLAPCDGKVAFAAPFRSYGRLLILDCGNGTDAVLAGLASLGVHAGQRLRRGEEVGAMPDWNPATQADRPTLYVELRRRGEPVNPTGLLNAS